MKGEYRPFSGAAERGFPFWTAVAAVCVGTLAANVITWGAVELRLRWEMGQIATMWTQQSHQSRQALERSRQEIAQEQQRQTLERERNDALDRQALAEQQRAANDRQRAAQEDASRKAAAWKRFYKPSPPCMGSTPTVECANEHIRATREFEKRFAAGTL